MIRVLLSMVFCMMALVVQAQCVELRYFHGKQRCVTCHSIEKCAKEVLDESFASQQKDKKISMRVIDFSTEQGKPVAADHKVSYSSLFIVNIDNNGKETRTDLTRQGFQYAKRNPEKFKKMVKEAITKALK